MFCSVVPPWRAFGHRRLILGAWAARDQTPAPLQLLITVLSHLNRPAMSTNAITEFTRRDLFDRLTLEGIDWSGRMSESAFLERIFRISQLPSEDSRVPTMEADVVLHRQNFYDWGGPEWVYDDGRLDLAGCPDAKLLEFLAFTIHPRVRPDQEEIERIVDTINPIIGRDGYQLVVVEEVSGKRIFAGVPTVAYHGTTTEAAARIADEMASSHVARQVARMKSAVHNDPALAIGSAKELVESICKGILCEHGAILTGSETLPQLVKVARDKLGLSVPAAADEILRRTLSGLSNIVQGLAELRGKLGTGHGASPDTELPPVEVAGLAVGMATTLVVFLYEVHRKQCKPTEPVQSPVLVKKPVSATAGPDWDSDSDIPF